MSLEALANFGEFVSGIAVVISLIYLAMQVRANSEHLKENTASIQGASEIASNDFAKDIYLSRIQNPQAIEVQLKGDKGDTLSSVEAIQYHMIQATAFDGHQTFFVQHQRGLTGDEIWNYWVRYFEQYVQVPGVRAWWEDSKGIYDPGFRRYIDELCSKPPNV